MLRGATPYELAFGRQYKEDLCEYGEPVYGYVHPGTNKAAARWRRALFLGKADSQNSFVLFDGQSIVLSKSIRRISTTWRSHLAYYLHCKCYSWQFKSGFGARILPTMKKAIPQSASFEVPLAPIESSKLHDPEAEAVIQYAEQEIKAEEEQIAMSLNDPINVHAQVQQQQRAQLQEEPTVFDDGQPVGDGVVWVHNSEAAGPVLLNDPGLAVPVTPPRDDLTLDSPRGRSTVRANDPGGAESEESKRAKVEEPKKQRINRLQLEYEERLSAVRIAYKEYEYFTMDDYSTDLNVDDDLCEDDEFWYGEDKVKLGDIPEALWLDAPTDVIPSHAPEAWIDELADQVEIQRLCSMKVLVRAGEYHGDVSGKLTTRFVRDWRLKPYGEQKTLRWVRRSRFVAREFANDKRLDTFSPATGAHTANLLPIQYLWQKQQAMEMENKGDYEVWVVWM